MPKSNVEAALAEAEASADSSIGDVAAVQRGQSASDQPAVEAETHAGEGGAPAPPESPAVGEASATPIAPESPSKASPDTATQIDTETPASSAVASNGSWRPSAEVMATLTPPAAAELTKDLDLLSRARDQVISKRKAQSEKEQEKQAQEAKEAREEAEQVKREEEAEEERQVEAFANEINRTSHAALNTDAVTVRSRPSLPTPPLPLSNDPNADFRDRANGVHVVTRHVVDPEVVVDSDGRTQEEKDTELAELRARRDQPSLVARWMRRARAAVTPRSGNN